MRRAGTVLALVMLSTLVASSPGSWGQELPRGKLLRRELAGQTYYLYVPAKFSPKGQVLAVVHGASRTAERYARAWLKIVEREKLVLVAPLFARRTFPDYQRLNFAGPRADLHLHAILDEVGRLTGAQVQRFYLYGFSGGGQFSHRYALVHPERLLRVAVGAPGWWCLPDATLDYPLGIKKSATVPPDVEFRVDELLRLPLAVVIGEHDTKRGRSLRQEATIDGLQGHNRVERGQRWFTLMRQLAGQKKIPYRFELYLIAGAGHSGSHPAIVARAAQFLFSDSSEE